jgi:hypothetical protein
MSRYISTRSSSLRPSSLCRSVAMDSPLLPYGDVALKELELAGRRLSMGPLPGTL